MSTACSSTSPVRRRRCGSCWKVGNLRDKLTLREKVEAGTRVMVGRALEVIRRVANSQSHGQERVTRLSTRNEARENTLLIVSHAKKRCGINQYGLNVFEALAGSKR